MINTPLFHIHGWGAPFQCVFSANKIVLPGKFTPQGFASLFRRKSNGDCPCPTMLAMLIEYKDLKKYDLNSLLSVTVGGAALNRGLKDKAEEMIPGFSAVSGYGMTETAPSIVYGHIKTYLKDLPKEQLDDYRVKTGLPVPGLEVRVIDQKGKPVPQDNTTVGEIVLRVPG